jgi:hypothetical protein
MEMKIHLIPKNKPKEDTIEEAAINYANYNEQIKKAVQEAVKFGAKWQAERMFSEEEVRQMLWELFGSEKYIDGIIEQFKKTKR